VATHLANQVDFDTARLELIRRRVLVYAYAVGCVLIAISLLSVLVVREGGNRPHTGIALAPAAGGVMMIIMATIRIRRRRRDMTLQAIVRRSSLFIVLAVIMQIPSSKVTADAIAQIMMNAGLQRVSIGALMPLLVSMFAVHLTASLILPYSLWESARPVLLILLIALVASPFAPDPWPARFGGMLALLIVGLPGMLICWLRFSRFREVVELRFLNTRYAEVQRELQYARRIHEKLFPTPINRGPVQFGFRYEPMSQIGGDFVDVIRPDGNDAEGALTVVLVDVTGHGIVAALAVNRLHGEIKRTLASLRAGTASGSNNSGSTSSGASNSSGAVANTNRQADPLLVPQAILASLNEYVHLTLADESVFATALAVTIDARQRKLSWVNAGHPPAFLCRANGKIDLLDSTAMMLGPLGNEDIDTQPQTIDFAEGDVLIAYTDGAIECRGKSDDQLGIDGLRAVVESARHKPVEPMLDAIMSAIATFRAGTADDDTLVLAISPTSAGVKTSTTRVLASSSSSSVSL
jgi:serine phosphatase RsbU (regulator of sigma subunit)